MYHKTRDLQLLRLGLAALHRLGLRLAPENVRPQEFGVPDFAIHMTVAPLVLLKFVQ